MLSENEGWAVGGETTSITLHYQDGRWESVPSPTTNGLDHISMVSRSEGWVISHDLLFHYQDGIWQEEPLDIEPYNWLLDIDMVDENNGWIVGNYGLILHYQNGIWQREENPYSSNYRVWTVAAVSADEAWAVAGRTHLLHYHNNQWELVEHPGNFDIASIEMLNPHEGWAVGGGILHYTNENISE